MKQSKKPFHLIPTLPLLGLTLFAFFSCGINGSQRHEVHSAPDTTYQNAHTIYVLEAPNSLQVHIRRNKFAGIIPPPLFDTYYLGSTFATNGERYYDLEVRRSEKIDFKLSDSTRVWLNAGSHLRLSWDDRNRRMVELDGEGLFQPTGSDTAFAVRIGEDIVVSSHDGKFAVTAFPELGFVRVINIEGKVDLRVRAKHYPLAADSTAEINRQTGVLTRIERDPDMAIAWTDNLLGANGNDLNEILIRIRNWWNKDFRITGSIGQERFSGDFSTELPIKSIINQLEHQGITFRERDGYYEVAGQK